MQLYREDIVLLTEGKIFYDVCWALQGLPRHNNKGIAMKEQINN